MPGLFQQADKLHYGTVPSNQGMGRHAHISDGCEVRMLIRVQTVGKKLLNVIPAKLVGRKADVMHHQQAYSCALGPGAIIRGWTPAGKRKASRFAKQRYVFAVNGRAGMVRG